MLKKIFLSAVFALSLAIPVRAGTNGLSVEQMENCANYIDNFEKLKHKEKIDILTQFSGNASFGRDIAVSYAKYSITTALDETKAQCGGDYNTQAIGYELYRDGIISSPSINDYLRF
jgi:hypothetical protein